MAYAVLRVEKLKTAVKITKAVEHNHRTRETPNADPNIENIILVNCGSDVYRSVVEHIRAAGAKIRKNSVLAYEIFLSASPEFFFDQENPMPGRACKDKLSSWKTEAFKWLQNEFGQNIIDCRLHLDECVPHIHVITVPLTPDNRLSSFEVFSKPRLQYLQTSYAKATSSLGLERGIPSTRVDHIRIQQYYQTIMMADDIIKAVPEIPVPPPMMSAPECKEFQRTTSERLRTDLRPVIELATYADLTKKSLARYKAKCTKLLKENEDLNAFKSPPTLSYPMILERLGLIPYPLHLNWWIGSNHLLKVDPEKRSFQDLKNGKNGTGYIELVQLLHNCGFLDAATWIGKEFGDHEALKVINWEAKEIIPYRKKKIGPLFKLPKLRTEFNDALNEYLFSLNFDSKITIPLRDNLSVYPSVVNNRPVAVFVCRNAMGPVGAELEGLYDLFYGMHAYSDRQEGIFSLGDPGEKSLIVCQDAIEAISFKQLHPGDRDLVISTAGPTDYHPLIDELVDKEWCVKIAFGNCDAGKFFAEKIKQAIPEVEIIKPELETWHAMLQDPGSGNKSVQAVTI